MIGGLKVCEDWWISQMLNKMKKIYGNIVEKFGQL
jgi:hypothetical protein